MNYKSDVGIYTYSTTTQPHAVTQAGTNSYAYDQNGNMTSRTVGEVVWTYAYNAENQLTQVKKNSQLISEYGYDSDGKRVWAKDYEGYLPENPKQTVYVGDYYEVRVEGYRQPSGGTPSQPCTQTYCAYFPFVANTVTENISYYYADGQRIAMKDDGVVSYLYSDQLGSVSAVADGTGALMSKTLYHPWGTTKYVSGTSPTDYAYTGQMQEDEIYFYNARWYDPQLGRFMQADTIVPLQVQGTQAWDRFAYVNNNPIRYTDPSGKFPVIAAFLIAGAVGGAAYSLITQVSDIMADGQTDFWGALSQVDAQQVFDTAFATTATVAGIAIVATSGVAMVGIGTTGVALAANSPKLFSIGQDLISFGDQVATWLGSDIITTCSPIENKVAEPHEVDFLVTPNGEAIPVPTGAKGPAPAINGLGFQFQGGSGGYEMNSRVTGVRIMDPTIPNTASPGYPGGYVCIFECFWTN